MALQGCVSIISGTITPRAIYSLLNVKVRDNYGEYYNNTASIENDYYNASTISLVIGSGNYTMYKNNSTWGLKEAQIMWNVNKLFPNKPWAV